MPHIHDLFDFVISVCIVHRGKVLLVHHKTYDEWLPIGGHVELNEDPEQALHREVREECGLPIRLLQTAPAIAHPGVKPIPAPAYMDVHRTHGKHRHIAFVYFAVSRTDRARLLEREHHSLKWFSLRDLSDPRYRVTSSIQFYCRKAVQAAAKVGRSSVSRTSRRPSRRSS
jgi:8-oxo-dGTP pyrophosphatase MutT (NUDIX family)